MPTWAWALLGYWVIAMATIGIARRLSPQFRARMDREIDEAMRKIGDWRIFGWLDD